MSEKLNEAPGYVMSCKNKELQKLTVCTVQSVLISLRCTVPRKAFDNFWKSKDKMKKRIVPKTTNIKYLFCQAVQDIYIQAKDVNFLAMFPITTNILLSSQLLERKRIWSTICYNPVEDTYLSASREAYCHLFIFYVMYQWMYTVCHQVKICKMRYNINW